MPDQVQEYYNNYSSMYTNKLPYQQPPALQPVNPVNPGLQGGGFNYNQLPYQEPAPLQQIQTTDPTLGNGFNYNQLPQQERSPLQPVDATDPDPTIEADDQGRLLAGIEKYGGAAGQAIDFTQNLLTSPDPMQRGYSAYNMPSQINVEGAQQAYQQTAGGFESALDYGQKGAKIGAAFGGVGALVGGAIGGIAGAIKGSKEKKQAKHQAGVFQQQQQAEDQRFRETQRSDELNKARSGLYGRSNSYNAGQSGYSIYL